ncbi:cysteine dioxygenase family protein [Teichococcus vastitatis]|uniref:cysteine dioxygenase family protein n=1 Tax=Teichococcus vastitatis TaxID=2307076 RepID=UPI000E7523A5|nr:cysteine dioxygenase family protein [Pseudoroseomonas vastitatis]
MLITRPRTKLDAMLEQVSVAADAALPDRAAAVADTLAPFAMLPGLLASCTLTPDPLRYTRHKLFSDPRGRFAVAALVWEPGQMSPIHAHRTWCALAVQQGVLTETFYGEGGSRESDMEQQAVALRLLGDTSHGSADPRSMHRLANLSCSIAVSIHVYGVPYEAFGEGVNLVYGG